MEEVALQEDKYNGRRRRCIYRLKHNAGNESLEAYCLHHLSVLEVLLAQIFTLQSELIYVLRQQ
jgi:hypothetical protein